KLARIAGDRQVLCVTHLPQVAALADRHFHIEKATDGGRTTTRCRVLSPEGRVEEIARMIGGAEVTQYTLAAARDLIRAAEEWKALQRGQAASV
ncbi:MAG: DNA repair protein RecN, partial [Symbiobacteriaceae bacterium]